MLAAVSGRDVDRLPLELAGFQGADLDSMREHPDRMKIAERILPHTHYYHQIPSGINRYLVTPSDRMHSKAETLGNGNIRTTTTIDTPKGVLTGITERDGKSDTTWTIKYPVESLQDIEAIASVPWRLPEELSQRIQDSRDAVVPQASAGGKAVSPGESHEAPAIHVTDLNRCIIESRISSPMVCVAGMMKYETYLELVLTERKFILDLTEECRRRILDVLAVLFERPGIDYIWLGGSEWVTPPMASPAVYDDLVQEQERSLIEYIHTHGRGVEGQKTVVHIHCHGHTRHAIRRCIERGADYTEPVEPPPDGDITMAEAKRLADGRISLGGNIECRILCNEDESAVEHAVRAAYEGGRDRFVLRPTEGPSPVMSDREKRNYLTVVRLWEEL